MKHIILLLSILISLNSFNQTVVSYREATLNDSPSYTLDGIAYIEELSDGTFRFRLSSSYATQSGPDVQIFMTNDNSFTTPISTVGALFVEDIGTQTGGISHFSGAYSKILPGISSLSDFDHVVFTCVGFGFLHWGNGSFGTVITPCVNTSSTVTETVCGSYTSPSGQMYTSSGTFINTIPNALGCDSIITINLTVNTVDVTTTQTDNVVMAEAAGATYQWINCSNTTVFMGETNQSYTITDTDSYAVIVTQNGCSDTSSCVDYCFPTASSIAETACGSYTAPSGQVFTSSGMIMDVISNAAGCDSVITIDLTVNPLDLTLSMTENIVTANATGATYQWINCSTNSTLMGETNQNYTIMDNDSYAVIVTQNGCSDTSACVNFCTATSSSFTETVCGNYVSPSGQMYITSGTVIDTISNTLGCDSIITIDLTVIELDLTTTLTENVMTSNAPGATYQWLNCSNNEVLTGETNQSYTILDLDTYAVIVTQNGCSDTSDCVAYAFSSVKETNFGSKIRMYPNPTENETQIDLGSLTEVSIEVTDISGKVLYFINNVEYSQITLNTTLFRQGVYFVNVKNASNQRVLKLVKQ